MAEEILKITDLTMSNNKSASDLTSGLVKLGNGSMKEGILKIFECGRNYERNEIYNHVLNQGRREGGIIGCIIGAGIGIGIGLGICIHTELEKTKAIKENEKLKIQHQIMLNEIQEG